MNIALADLSQHRTKLFPFTLTRPIGDLRVGGVDFLTAEELSAKFASHDKSFELVVNGILCPDAELIVTIQGLTDNQALYHGEEFLAARGSFTSLTAAESLDTFERVEYSKSYTAIRRSWDIFNCIRVC